MGRPGFGLRERAGLSGVGLAGTSLAFVRQAAEGGFERGVGQLILQVLDRCAGPCAQVPPGGRSRGPGNVYLHPHPNSSNLATPCLEKGNKLIGHLAQLGGQRTAGRCDDHGLLSEFGDLATMLQGWGYDGVVMPLQGDKTGGLTGKSLQGLVRIQECVQAGWQVHSESRKAKGITWILF